MLRRRAFAAFVLLLFAAFTIWWVYFTQPAPTSRPLFQGVVYQRRILRKPRPVTVHLLVIDMRTPGLRFFVTPPDHPGAEHPLIARHTTEFLREHHLQAAINADFYYPWKSNSPLDYYPHKHDPVVVEGDAVTEGKRYADRDAKGFPTLYISKNNRPSLTLPKGEKPWNAVGGHILLHDGIPFDLPTHTEPRTAAGWSPDGNTLYLACIDGRQKGYSEGLTIPELAQFFQSLGCRDAINLDGGGSTTMAISDGVGGAEILNRPIDQHIPGKERYVGNNLGIYAPPLPKP